MKMFKARLEYGLAVVVANDAIEVLNLLNSNEFIFDEISITDIEVIEPFVVTEGFPSIIGAYQE